MMLKRAETYGDLIVQHPPDELSEGSGSEVQILCLVVHRRTLTGGLNSQTFVEIPTETQY